MFGTPGISIKKYKIVIFIDSCFWHVCPLHGNHATRNLEFLEKKLLRNQQRDIEVNEYYLSHGWNIKRICEHEIKQDFNAVKEVKSNFINNKKKANQKSLDI